MRGTRGSKPMRVRGDWTISLPKLTRSSRPDVAPPCEVRHFATPDFWYHYRQLPAAVQALADKNFALLHADPRHPSLRSKSVAGPLWSVHVGLSYRALARQREQGFVWVWIGHHTFYDQILRSPPK